MWVKACGHWICGNWMYPFAFAWVLPSITGPVMLVTSKMVGNALLLICRCRTHDPRLCRDCPPYASMCTLGLSSWPSHSWPNSCWALWAGRMLQPAPVSTSQSVWKTWDPLDFATHRGLICSVSLPWIWWTLAVVLRHLIGAFTCSLLTKYGWCTHSESSLGAFSSMSMCLIAVFSLFW